ncbi:MAG: response regulator transcription factor [Candidatus Marinimicrobia bacterium]|nr:response regulator transcription factor [Candidatus Neomarinimicrobiota bacterium]
MIKVLIIDDHELVRQGIRKMLENEVDFTIIGEAPSRNDADALLSELEVDVVLLDISFPDDNGIDILKSIKKQYPDLPVLILSMHEDKQYIVEAMQANASGYLTKGSPKDELLTAIRKASFGRTYLPPELREVLAEWVNTGESGDLHDQLSERELQVFKALAAGRKVKDIAENLHLSVKTISTYRSRIMDKMQLEKNADIIRYAVEKEIPLE